MPMYIFLVVLVIVTPLIMAALFEFIITGKVSKYRKVPKDDRS